MTFETERLILRPFRESDAEDLYQCAKDPEVGPVCGWMPHKNVEESLFIIKNVFTNPEAYAICFKSDDRVIGAIELMLNGNTDSTNRDDECELGYWIGKSFWGQGIMPEASEEMLRHAFEDLNMTTVWCGYHDGNDKSKRVQEKLGFDYHHVSHNVFVALTGETITRHTTYMTKEKWQDTIR